jgi:hypothetical protein
MREHILAAVVGGNEAEALAIVEPLDDTCTHVYRSLKRQMTGVSPKAGTSRETDEDLRNAACGNDGTSNFT